MIRILLPALLALAAVPALTAQGTQQPIGGGCPSYTPPTVSGPLTIGSSLSIEASGCIVRGVGSVQLLFFGTTLPQGSWLRLPLRHPFGTVLCYVVLSPVAALDLTGQRLPFALPIPNDPRLRGARIALQSYCSECGIIACYDAFTQGLEITIG